MLLGRTGLWMLKNPFTEYASNGLMGEIVAAGFIQDLVANGQNIQFDVYEPVKATSLYSRDLKENCIIITFDVKGKYYRVPDKYIENLYDGNQVFLSHYLIARIGLLPETYDMTEATTAMARAISDAIGVEVKAKDIYTSASEQGGMILSDKEGEYATLKRLAGMEDNQSIFAELDDYKDKLEDAEKKFESLSEEYLKLIG